MRKLLVSCFFFMAGQAQAFCVGQDITLRLSEDQRAELAERVAATPYATGRFWQATKGSDSIALIGTIHVYDDRLNETFDTARSVLDGVELLLPELTMEDQAAMQTGLGKDTSVMLLPDNATLVELLEPEVWEELSATLSDRGIPPAFASRMQPWFISMTMAAPTCAMEAMQRGLTGLDVMVLQKAGFDGLPAQSLDDWPSLLDTLASDPLDQQMDLLRMSMLGRELDEDMFYTMLDRYFAGRTAEVWYLSEYVASLVAGLDQDAAKRIQDEMHQELLVDRNNAWLPKIIAATADHDRIAVMVGAAHLPGDDGLLKLLETDGWTITPIAN